ncbi:hypothetical protein, partial [uncultured Ruthenibacterium sp.]|uniref:hypothetical protein n=1 Tax=uncultured Ruthenibacterium sp. TaxID=1905347 RepID=UPI00349EAC66
GEKSTKQVTLWLSLTYSYSLGWSPQFSGFCKRKRLSFPAGFFTEERMLKGEGHEPTGSILYSSNSG